MELFAAVLKELAVGAMIVGSLTYLAKQAINHFFSRKVEEYKSELEQKTATAIAAFQTNLEKEQIRLQIAYGGVYQKQADTILDLYRLLTQFERLMHFAANPGEGSVEYSEFIEIWQTLMQAYEQRQILLPEIVDRQVGEMAKMIFTAVHDIRRAEDRIRKVGHALSQEQFDRLYKSQDKAYEILNRIPDIKMELKASLRRILGVHHSEEG